jgi:hypothetical protein
MARRGRGRCVGRGRPGSRRFFSQALPTAHFPLSTAHDSRPCLDATISNVFCSLVPGRL